MGIAHSYEPCFEHVPDDPAERWTLLREFVCRWHNINLPHLRDCERASNCEEDELSIRFPHSLREWVAFSKDLITLGEFDHVLRDCYRVARLKGHRATSIMLQGEGDVYWAVTDQNLQQADPQIDEYVEDFDEPKRPFVHGRIHSPTTTSFVLGHMSYFLGPGYVRSNGIDDSLIQDMSKEFPVVVRFDHLQVFEKRNLVAFINPQNGGHRTLIVACHSNFTDDDMPPCIRRMSP